MTDQRFNEMLQDLGNDHRKTMQTLDRVHEEANERIDRVHQEASEGIDCISGSFSGSFDRLNGTIDRIEGNIPSTAFIVFWMGVVPLVGILGGIWFLGLR